ncbi:MAG: VTT domain-containing protein [Candidatus Doudnabacteria bacterium]|nr:VTT domain-containing protein [Candidatus Doudnabacteria bacterium]
MLLFNYEQLTQFQLFPLPVYDRLNLMTEKQRKIFDSVVVAFLLGFIVWAFLSFFKGQLAFDVVINNPVGFKEYIVSLGPLAEIGYIAAVMLEVLVAFIPGWFVYPAGGALFGAWQTVALVLVGNFLAASISFWIGHKWGAKFLKTFVSAKHMEQFERFMEKRGALSVFLLKLNPITSLDIWNYLAGASPIKFWKFSLANILGIAPLVAISAILGEQTLNILPQFLGVLVLLTVVYVVWFILNLPKKIRNKKTN